MNNSHCAISVAVITGYGNQEIPYQRKVGSDGHCRY